MDEDQIIETHITASFEQENTDALDKTMCQIQHLIYRCFNKEYTKRPSIDDLYADLTRYRDNLIGN